VTQAAGYSLRWFRDQFGAGGEPAQDAYKRLVTEASAASAAADGLLWAPYLMGERIPYLDPHARGALVGISATHTRAHVIRAILGGVAFSLRDTLTIFAELKIPVEPIRLSGDGARGSLWQRIQADVYGMPIGVLEVEEGPAYGAALLAGVGVGARPSVEKASDATVRVSKRIEPSPENVALMNRQYVAYGKLYPALRDIWRSSV
jgi:xylulokinase